MQRFKKLIYQVKNNEKLGDDHINAANQLLRSQFEELQGLSSPVIGQKLSFDKFDWMLGYAGYAYYQVLHTGADHWVTIKAISDHEVYIYDSIFLLPTYHTLKQIAAIVQTKSPKIKLHLERVQMQSNSIDCGVYALAFSTDLCYGKDPATCRYAGSKELRQHLVTCFENGHMSPFPATSVCKKDTLMKELYVYCKCRLPYVLEHVKRPTGEEVTCMVKCYICDNFYHCSCVNLTVEQAKKMNSTKEFWWCDYP